MKLKDKVTLVTGGAGFLGLAAAKRFLAEGAKVLLIDVNQRELERTVADLNSDRVAGFTADVSSEKDVKAYAAHAVERYGKIDVFFNNAGIEGPNAPIAEFPEDGFDKVMQVNVRGVFLGMKYVAPHMQDGGSIILSSSIAGLMGSGNFVAYTTSKHAVIGIMRDTAIDLAPRGIRVNTIHPGFVESEMLLRIARRQQPGVADAELLRQLGAQAKLGRCVTPEEIADAVAFLASPESRMITGQTLVIDGGVLL